MTHASEWPFPFLRPLLQTSMCLFGSRPRAQTWLCLPESRPVSWSRPHLASLGDLSADAQPHPTADRPRRRPERTCHAPTQPGGDDQDCPHL